MVWTILVGNREPWKGFRGKEAGTRFVVGSSSCRWTLDHREVGPEARRQCQRVRGEVTRAWPDEGASAAGGDEPNLSPCSVGSPSFAAERERQPGLGTASPSPRPPRRGYHILSRATSVPLGFTPQPKPATGPLSAPTAPVWGPALPCLPTSFATCFFLLHSVKFLNSTARQGLGCWALRVVNSAEGSLASWNLASMWGEGGRKGITAQLAVRPPGGEGQRSPLGRGSVCRRPALSTGVSSRDLEVAWGRAELGAACGGLRDGEELEEEGTGGARPDRREAGRGGAWRASGPRGGASFPLRARKSHCSGLNCGPQKTGPLRTWECGRIRNACLCRCS